MSRRTSGFSVFISMIIIGLMSSVYAQDTEIELSIIEEARLEDASAFSLSNDNSKLLIARTNGDLYIWDIGIGEVVLTIGSSTFNATLNSISWSSDDSLIAGAFSDKGRVWNSQTGQLIYELDEHPHQPLFEDTGGGVHGIIFSPMKSLFATYTMFDTTVLLYDSETQEIIYELSENPESYVMELKFSPDGSLLAVRQFSGQITIWDTRTGEKLYQFPGEAMAFSPDSTILATGAGRFYSSIWIWDLSSGEQLREITAPLQLNQLQWADDNQTIYGRFGGPPLNDGWIYNGEAIRSWDISEPTSSRTFALSENVRLPLLASEQMTIIGFGSYHLDGEILIWDTGNNDVFRHVLSSDIPLQYYETFINPIYTFDAHLNQGFVAVGHDEGIWLWSVATDQYQNVITNSRITKLTFIAEGDRIVSMTTDNELIIWQIA